jgi:hypothetical protein
LKPKEPECAKHFSRKSDLTLNKPFLEETHHIVFLLPLLTLTESNTWKKEAKSSASQVKLTFHWLKPPKNSKLSAK